MIDPSSCPDLFRAASAPGRTAHDGQPEDVPGPQAFQTTAINLVSVKPEEDPVQLGYWRRRHEIVPLLNSGGYAEEGTEKEARLHAYAREMKDMPDLWMETFRCMLRDNRSRKHRESMEQLRNIRPDGAPATSPESKQSSPTSTLITPLSVVDARQLESIPPPTPLVPPWLNEDTLAMLYAPSGAGKSFLALDWALRLATGTGVPTARPVLYIAAEGVAGLSIRVAAWCDYQGLSLDNGEVLSFLPQAVQLRDRKQIDQLVAIVEALHPGLVVLDTLARCTAGLEENSASEMGRAVEAMDRIRRAASGCVLAVHHSGKDSSSGARGSSALRAAVDTELELTPTGDGVVITVRKQKDAEEGPPVRLTRQSHAGSAVLVPFERTESCALSTGSRTVLDALARQQDANGLTVREWEAAAGVSRSTLYEHRRRLLDLGLVRDVGSGARGRYIATECPE